jgi:hypothetical protein
VLTTRGWLAIGQLREGDDVIEVADKGFEIAKEHRDHRMPDIRDVFHALARGGAIQATGGRVDDFHGDGGEGHVDVVLAARPLSLDSVTARRECGDEFGLAMSSNPGGRLRAAKLALLRVLQAAHRAMCGGGQALALIGRQAAHSQQLGFANAASAYAGLGQPPLNYGAFNAETPRNGQFAFAGHVGRNNGGNVQVNSVEGGSTDSTIGLDANGAQPQCRCAAIPEISFDAAEADSEERQAA